MKKLTNKQRKFYWNICIAIAVALALFSFSPLILSHKDIEPKFLAMPFTLWTEMLMAILLVILTYIGGRVHPREEEGGEA
jgi:hypothetical protein